MIIRRNTLASPLGRHPKYAIRAVKLGHAEFQRKGKRIGLEGVLTLQNISCQAVKSE